MAQMSCRYPINRAVKEGIQVRVNQNFEQFYEVNKAFTQQKGSPLAPMDLDTMRKYGTLFTAEYHDEIIGGQLYFEDDPYFFSRVSAFYLSTGQSKNGKFA